MGLYLLHYFDIFQQVRERRVHFLYPEMRRFSPCFDTSVHTFCTREAYTTMATFTKPSRFRRVQVRYKGRYVGETFLRHDHAREWATEVEHEVD